MQGRVSRASSVERRHQKRRVWKLYIDVISATNASLVETENNLEELEFDFSSESDSSDSDVQ